MAGNHRDEAFGAYVAARQHALIRVAYLMTGEYHSAQDLLQATLARTYLAWHRIRDPSAVDAYVRRVMTNEFTGWWRRARYRRERPSDALPEQLVEDGATAIAERDELWSLVRTLPRRQRAAVVLRYYEDLTEAQTANILGCSVGTVKSQTSRALASIRKQLDLRERGPDDRVIPTAEETI